MFFEFCFCLLRFDCRWRDLNSHWSGSKPDASTVGLQRPVIELRVIKIKIKIKKTNKNGLSQDAEGRTGYLEAGMLCFKYCVSAETFSFK